MIEPVLRKPDYRRVHAVEGALPRRPWIQMVWAALMLPKEHGAWAMLLMPYAVGAGAAGWRDTVALLLLLVSVFFGFSAIRPLEVTLQSGPSTSESLARRWQAALRLAAFATVGGIAGLPLLLHYQRWALIGIGLAAVVALSLQLFLRRRRVERTWPARLLAIVALSATGPAAYYAASGALDRFALAVWLLATLYSGASVFYVRLFHRPHAGQRGSESAGRRRAQVQLGMYLAVAIAVTLALSLGDWLPPLSVIALIPLAAKVSWAIRSRSYRPTLKQLGLAEIGHTALFALLATVTISSWG